MGLNRFSLVHLLLLLGGVATIAFGVYGLFVRKAYACVFFYIFKIADGKLAVFLNLSYIVLGSIVTAIFARFLKG